ncbi:hypothetical protein HDU93_008797 [Gonapodya sp. JEL0774]|nr:hypothetical protein HDU93_008797 [Gonapodya sp. JEL0774]
MDPSCVFIVQRSGDEIFFNGFQWSGYDTAANVLGYILITGTVIFSVSWFVVGQRLFRSIVWKHGAGDRHRTVSHETRQQLFECFLKLGTFTALGHTVTFVLVNAGDLGWVVFSPFILAYDFFMMAGGVYLFAVLGHEAEKPTDDAPVRRRLFGGDSLHYGVLREPAPKQKEWKLPL